MSALKAAPGGMTKDNCTYYATNGKVPTSGTTSLATPVKTQTEALNLFANNDTAWQMAVKQSATSDGTVTEDGMFKLAHLPETDPAWGKMSKDDIKSIKNAADLAGYDRRVLDTICNGGKGMTRDNVKAYAEKGALPKSETPVAAPKTTADAMKSFANNDAGWNLLVSMDPGGPNKKGVTQAGLLRLSTLSDDDKAWGSMSSAEKSAYKAAATKINADDKLWNTTNKDFSGYLKRDDFTSYANGNGIARGPDGPAKPLTDEEQASVDLAMRKVTPKDQQEEVLDGWAYEMGYETGFAPKIANANDSPSMADMDGMKTCTIVEEKGMVIVGNKAYFDSPKNDDQHAQYEKAVKVANTWYTASHPDTWDMSEKDFKDLHMTENTPFGADNENSRSKYTLWEKYDYMSDKHSDIKRNGADMATSDDADKFIAKYVVDPKNIKQTPSMKEEGLIAFYDQDQKKTYVVSKDVSPKLYDALQGALSKMPTKNTVNWNGNNKHETTQDKDHIAQNGADMRTSADAEAFIAKYATQIKNLGNGQISFFDASQNQTYIVSKNDSPLFYMALSNSVGKK
ncbi:hypothetical protein ACO0LB_14560 [Undibacterium sp. SXout7W]|uniref:hypothetical protein n=1 Tax=Undibacterium sp. SXout7W TaxID=3413049 RepID=UPI003BEF5420